MAKTETSRVKKDNFLVNYLKETRAEVRKVHWPTQQEARTLTLVVLGVTIAMAVLLGFLDFAFGYIMAGIINLNPVAIIVSVVIVVGMLVAGHFLMREE